MAIGVRAEAPGGTATASGQERLRPLEAAKLLPLPHPKWPAPQLERDEDEQGDEAFAFVDGKEEVLDTLLRIGLFEAELKQALEIAEAKIFAAFKHERGDKICADKSLHRHIGLPDPVSGSGVISSPQPHPCPLASRIGEHSSGLDCCGASVHGGFLDGSSSAGVASQAGGVGGRGWFSRQSSPSELAKSFDPTSMPRSHDHASRSFNSDADGFGWMPAGEKRRNSRRGLRALTLDFMPERSKLQQVLTGGELDAPEVMHTGSMAKQSKVLWRKCMEALRNPFSEAVMGIFIILNAITIGVSADLERDWGGWAVIDGIFAVVFTIELILKWMSAGVVFYFRSSPSVYLNWLDFVLVVLALTEVLLNILSLASETGSTFVFSTMRILRLLRVARILRLARLPIFNELSMMVDGANGGLRTLMWSQVLIALFLYVVALIFRELLGSSDSSEPAQYFGSLSVSFFTVFRCLIANDCNDQAGRPIFVSVAKEHGWYFAATYCVASVLITFGLFNVIVAIYVENTVAAAKCNENRLKQERLNNKRMFESKTYELLEFILHSGVATGGRRQSLTGMVYSELRGISITLEMLDSLRSEPKFREILRALDIADEDHLDMFDTLDVNGSGEIDLEELVLAISKLRGDARRSDIVSVSLMVRNLQASLNNLEVVVRSQVSKIPRGGSKM